MLLNGEAIALAPKVFDTLEVFVQNAGRLIKSVKPATRILPFDKINIAVTLPLPVPTNIKTLPFG